MRSLSCLWAVVLAGCGGTDPCAGQAGTCVSARVEGMPSMLDQLRISVDGQPAPMSSPAQPGTFSLPVRIAIVLAVPPASPAAITVDGLIGGDTVASSGKQAVPLTVGGRTSFTFTLAPIASDGGPPGDGPPDLIPPPNVISFEPDNFTFPDTPRGSTSSTLATILFTNNTDHAVTATGMDGGGMPPMDNSFNFAPSSTCPTMMMGLAPLLAGQSCTLVFNFTPDVTGPIESDIVLFFDDGEKLGLTLKGKGIPQWTGESPAGATSVKFNAVWASGPADWWAVGQDPTNCPIWRSTGSGPWTNTNCGTMTSHNLFTISGTSASDVWLGGDGGTIWHYDGMGFTSQLIDSSSSLVTGVTDFGPKNAVAVTSFGNIWCVGSSGSFGGCPPFGMMSGFGSTTSVGGLNGENGYLLVTASGTGFIHFANATSWSTIPNVPGGSQLSSVWVAPNNKQDTFVVGANGLNGEILHYQATSGTVSEPPGNAQGPVLAVGGRIVSQTMGTYEVYAAGGIGPQVLHSTGNGQWSSAQIPVAQGISMHGIWVLPNGDVVVAGDSGQIAHYH